MASQRFLPEGNSRPVTSRQSQPHARLAELARRHLTQPFRKPPANHSRQAFEAFAKLWKPNQPCHLDAGCGTGESTAAIAKRYPDRLVVGVDQSEVRLAKTPRGKADNLVYVRADLVDFWLLAAQAGVKFERQYLLYPNPWPKPEHVGRRWPGHPILPSLLACGLAIELRTNWLVYAQEWALVYQLATGLKASVEPWHPQTPASAHERKYLHSGHELWRSVPENLFEHIPAFDNAHELSLGIDDKVGLRGSLKS